MDSKVQRSKVHRLDNSRVQRFSVQGCPNPEPLNPEPRTVNLKPQNPEPLYLRNLLEAV